MNKPCDKCPAPQKEIHRCEDYLKYEIYLQGKEDGFQEALTSHGINIYVDKIEADGARKFAEWLCKGVIPQDNPHVTYSVREMLNDGSSYEVEADKLIAEWQKGN